MFEIEIEKQKCNISCYDNYILINQINIIVQNLMSKKGKRSYNQS